MKISKGGCHNRFWKTSRTREDDLDEGRGNGEKDAKVCRRSKRENDNAADRGLGLMEQRRLRKHLHR